LTFFNKKESNEKSSITFNFFAKTNQVSVLENFENNMIFWKNLNDLYLPVLS